ncbi:hypothetical protein ACIGAN_05270 [Streptomyces sp. NPDC085931]|uniref:hypothetical protein n=1 Tax=Streptomyces sp. NPDC085931 TaxID=3365740 RepID=UPI0037D39FDE
MARERSAHGHRSARYAAGRVPAAATVTGCGDDGTGSSPTTAASGPDAALIAGPAPAARPPRAASACQAASAIAPARSSASAAASPGSARTCAFAAPVEAEAARGGRAAQPEY